MSRVTGVITIFLLDATFQRAEFQKYDAAARSH